MSRCIILTPFYEPNRGGVETFCKALYDEACKKYDTKVITINWKGQKVWKGLPFFEAVKIALILWFKCMSCDLENTTILAQGFIAGFVCVFLPCKHTVTTHALYDFKDKPKWFKKLCAWTLNNADKVYTEGGLCKKELKKIGVKNKKIKMYQHWVDLDTFYPGKKNKVLTVLFVGRPIFEKGIHIIEAVEADLKRWKVRFIYATNVEARKMPEVYRGADVLIVPSIYSESFARVVLEGCASGLVILASNKGSLPELVTNKIGWTMEPTTQNFRNRILYLHHEREVLNLMQINAREHAEEHFSNRNAEVML